MRIHLFLFSLFLLIPLYAQDTTEKVYNKQFFAELGGPGDLFSANLDCRFDPKSRLGLGYRVGIGFGIVYQDVFIDFEKDDDNWPSLHYKEETIVYAAIPVVINYLFGNASSPHTFEVGVGTTYLSKEVDLYNWNDNAAVGHFIGHLHFMYRKQPLTSGLTWRIGLMPVIGTAGDLSLSAAVGIGFSF